MISRVKSYKSVLDWLLIISQLTLLLMLCSLITTSWLTDEDGDLLLMIYAYIMSIIYILFSFIFAITAYFYLSKLRQFSVTKSNNMKNRVILGSMLIWCPLWIRGAFLLIRNQIDFEGSFVEPSIKNDDWWLPLFYMWYY